jgi:hypothetical protein
MAKRKKIGRSKAERDAWNAHVDETIRMGREVVQKGWADIQRKRGIDPPGPMPTLEELLQKAGSRPQRKQQPAEG